MDPIEKQELAILSEIGRIATSSADLTHKLDRIIEVIMQGMGRDGASIFLVDAPGNTVTLTAAVGLNQETVGKLTFPLGNGIAGWVAQQKVPLALLDPFSDSRFQYVPETGIERFKSLVAAPIMDGDICIGVLFVLSLQPWNASSSDVTLLTTTANQVSGIIRNAQLFRNIQERLAELAFINDITISLSASRDIKQVQSLIARSVTQALRAQGCSIRLMDLPEVTAGGTGVPLQYVPDEVDALDRLFGDECAARTAREKRAVLIPDTSRDEILKNVSGALPTSVISVPLIFHERMIGVITLYNKEGGLPFGEHDLRFLTTIASGAAVAVENAALFVRTERLAEEARARALEFSILYDVGTAMSATLNLDRLLRIILTAATMGGTGLGFNRAILLLTNERTGILQGMLGVGPTSWEEANRAWAEVARKQKSLMEWVQTGEIFESRDTEINAVARSIRISLNPQEGVLARTVLEKRPFNITNAGADPLVPRRLRETLKADSFATVPLIAKDRVLGVILVDNLFTGRAIADHDVRFLTLFAHQAALTIENAMAHTNMETMNRNIRIMHEQLAQSEKMAALGTMMAEITHEIRNPLVSIGGFTRRLAKKLSDPDAKKYLDIILSEVGRLEGIIHDNLAYIKNVTVQTVRTDFNAIIDGVLAIYEDELRQRGIVLERSLADGLPALDLDPGQIKQAVVNVITNAMEAMGTGGTLSVRSAANADDRATVLDIADTGAGVPPEVMQNLFNPYYTTKVRGTGLGLPITLRIIKAHGGSITFRNRERAGALFTITLPWPKNTGS